ncbi:MAG: serine/threonine-protein kinase [Polyangiaceae bacterium]
MECLDDATLDDLIEGRLSGESLLRADSHLDSCHECSAVVTALASARRPANDAGGTERDPGALGELEAGATLGRFRVVERIGSGAMGTVYAAHDPELERNVAIKLLRPGAVAPAAVVEERMRREAQAMARLAHPNVVAVFDVGRTRGGIWLAMELVGGATLRVWAREQGQPRDWRAVRDVLVQAGRGLAAAHQAGLVHRDFKPDNVIVGDDGRVRVTDFGLARHAAQAPARAPAPGHQVGGGAPPAPAALPAVELTASGALLGTPAYMAPEQLDGGAADAASDQYAFAVAFFEALFGARPHAGATMRELRRSMHGAPVRPAGGPAVPRWLDQALARALSERPADRFPTMRELLAALEQDRARRRPLALAVAAGAAVAIAVTSVVVLVDRSAAVDPCAEGGAAAAAVCPPRAQSEVRAAFAATGSPIADESSAGVARGLDAFSAAWASAHRTPAPSAAAAPLRRGGGRARRLPPPRAGRGRGTGGHAGARRSADGGQCRRGGRRPATPRGVHHRRRPGRRATDRPGRAGGAAGDRAHPRRGARGDRRRQACSGAARAREAAAAAIALGHRPAIAEARIAVATLLRRTGAASAAAAEAREAIWAAEAARADASAARGWLELLAAQAERGAWTEAEPTVRHAAAATARLGDPPALRAAVLHGAGVVATNLGRGEEAAADLEQALALRRETHGAEHVEVARTLTALGNLERTRGRLDAALELHRRALAMDASLLGAAHPALARHHHNVAGVLRLMGKRSEAMASYQTALALELAALGEAHPSVGITRNSIGLVRMEEGDLTGARRELEAALAILEPLQHAERAAPLQNLGMVLARQGAHAEAMARLEAARALVVAAFGEAHPRVGEIDGILQASRSALAGAALTAAGMPTSPGGRPTAAPVRPGNEVPGKPPPARPAPSLPAPSPPPAPAVGAYAPAQTLDVQ